MALGIHIVQTFRSCHELQIWPSPIILGLKLLGACNESLELGDGKVRNVLRCCVVGLPVVTIISPCPTTRPLRHVTGMVGFFSGELRGIIPTAGSISSTYRFVVLQINSARLLMHILQICT